MSLLNQDEVGGCSFIDVLEEAVLRRAPIGVKLRSGEAFIDVVVDVLTESGSDYAVFRDHPRVKVSEIFGCSRAEPRLVEAPPPEP